MAYTFKAPSRSEVLYQSAFLLVAGVFFLFDRRDEVMDIRRLPSYLVFVTIALFIGYVLLPKYYARKKYVQFFASFVLCALAGILVEELVIEKIFYPDTRGKYFHGIAISLIEVLPVLLLLVSFKFAWDLHQKQKAIEQLQVAAKDSELRFLKSQINPHFLFNNLNNLYSYSITEPEKTSQIILELSSVLRYMLYDCQEHHVPLEKELKHLEDYVNLHELQIENRGEVALTIDNKSTGYAISPLIMVVFIENAFKHSTGSMTEDIFISMNITVSEQGKLRFLCENSYEEVSNIDNIVGGIGLENVRKRLELLYPDAHTLDITTDNSTYKVALTLELNKLHP